MMHVPTVPGQATEPATGSSESCLPQWQLLPAVSGLWIGQPEATEARPLAACGQASPG